MMNRSGHISYVLVTPARNEEALIEKTIQSVIAQTVLPTKWAIVNDGSTDNTASIVSRYAANHPWIELVNLPAHRDRSFAGKVHAFNAGLERVKDLDYEVIGSEEVGMPARRALIDAGREVANAGDLVGDL